MNRHRRWGVAGTLFLSLLLLLVPSAQAQRKASPAEVQQAKEHYAKAERHYNLGEFDQAVIEYRAAYDLTEQPALLFNIAQTYRLAGDAKQALHFYKTYIRLASKIANVDYVQSQIKAMELELAEAERIERERLAAEREKAAAERANAERAAAEQQRKVEEERRLAAAEQARLAREQARLAAAKSDSGPTLRLTGYIAGGVGLATTAVAVVLSMSAASGYDDVETIVDNGGPWTREAQDTLDSAETKDTVATVLFIGGGVAAAAGVGLWLVGSLGDDEPEARAITVVPTRGGAAATVRWRF